VSEKKQLIGWAPPSRCLWHSSIGAKQHLLSPPPKPLAVAAQRPKASAYFKGSAKVCKFSEVTTGELTHSTPDLSVKTSPFEMTTTSKASRQVMSFNAR
jgi:hypothetical protein